MGKVQDRIGHGLRNSVKWPELVGAVLAVEGKLPPDVRARVDLLLYNTDIDDAGREEVRRLIAPYDNNPSTNP